jgi:stage II sporulation protein P
MFVILALGTALIFAVAGAVAMVDAEHSLTSDSLGGVTKHLSDKSLSLVIGEGIPYWQEGMRISGVEPVLSRLAFELATSVDLRDPRTYLGRELPLFALFDTTILAKSDDVDFTSIPIESQPPPEIERELSKAMENADKENRAPDVSVGGLKVKQVLIYNTHFWESYTPELKNPVGKMLASDLKVNVTRFSHYLAGQLEKHGIGSMTAYRTYGAKKAYDSSRKMVLAVWKQHKDLNYFVDIHRDSLPRDKTTLSYNGKTYARLSFVVGKASDNYEQNRQLAEYLHNHINAIIPGLSKGVFEKPRNHESNGEYNQSLSPNSFLVEVGGVGNTFDEGYHSLDILAKVLSEKIQDAKPVTGKPAGQ